MYLLPNVKTNQALQGMCDAKKLCWVFENQVDERVQKAAARIAVSEKNGMPVYISHPEGSAEGYSLVIHAKEIRIEGKGAPGAFYGLMTLKMLLKQGKGMLSCCEITDYPDMPYRGVYQDTTRGRVPTLETLKKLADTLAEYKINSLQLYVEHSYEFKEYAFCREKLGYLTKAEIQELDCYCNDRFIELIPSLATFGHLYHLLQSENYKHLCELKDYEPKMHHYKERMLHHTINPLLDESFSLITSLIDQHTEAFSSDKFNICCDETFDLGTDVNKDQDKGELYIKFTKKLIDYLEAKGKTVMMWGDIVLQHPEKLSELSENLIFLNWDYDPRPNEEKVAALRDKLQYVCPGTHSWEGFHERIQTEEANILNLVQYGKKYDAKGILNTNWGDIGGLAGIDMSMYGLILGASAGWNTETKADDALRQFVSDYHYGAPKAMQILADLSEAAHYANWLSYNWEWSKYQDDSKEAFEQALQKCEQLTEQIAQTEFQSDEYKKEFQLAAMGDCLMVKWSATKLGYSLKSTVDFEAWIKEYKQAWLNQYKYSEFDELIRVFRDLEAGDIYR